LAEENAEVEFQMEQYEASTDNLAEEEYEHQSLLEEHQASELALQAKAYLNEFCTGVDFDDVQNTEVTLLC
jgi:hypothetical protein